MNSPPPMICKYSATAARTCPDKVRAAESHTQQWTPLLPENTHKICLYPKSTVKANTQSLWNIAGTKGNVAIIFRYIYIYLTSQRTV